MWFDVCQGPHARTGVLQLVLGLPILEANAKMPVRRLANWCCRITYVLIKVIVQFPLVGIPIVNEVIFHGVAVVK